MPQVTLPNALVDGVDVAYGSHVYANDSAIVAVVNGQLANDNISSSAGIDGKKISTAAGERVPTNAIEDMAVTSGKLRSESDDLNDATRAVTADHIRNGIVERKKLSTVVGKKIAFNQLEAVTVTSTLVTINGTTVFNPVGGGVPLVTTGMKLPLTLYPVAGALNYTIQAESGHIYYSITRIDHLGYSLAINPASYGLSALPVATTKILHIYPSNVTYSNPLLVAPTLTFNLNITYITIA